MALNIVMALVYALSHNPISDWTDVRASLFADVGWGNLSFRLGNSMSFHLDKAKACVPHWIKEQTGLPKLAQTLPVTSPN